MATLSAWMSNALPGADEALTKLEKLNRDSLIYRHDEAVVSWGVGRKKPKTVIASVWRFCEGACEHALHA
jgi:hypothetical protein